MSHLIQLFHSTICRGEGGEGQEERQCERQESQEEHSQGEHNQEEPREAEVSQV